MGKALARLGGLLLILTAAFAAGVFSNSARLPKTGVDSSCLRTVISAENDRERVDFVDEKGTVTDASDRGYATILRQLDPEGRPILEEYRRADGSAAKLSAGYSAVERSYDAAGRCVRLTYLNAKGKPVNLPAGYATITYTYNDQGYTDTQMYFDAKGRPGRLWLGASGCRILYGREVTTVYLGADGLPMRTEAGYTQVCRSFDGEGRVRRECYLDGAGQPAMGTRGEYGVEFAYDGEDRVISETYLGPEGKPAAIPKGYSTVRYSYSPGGKKTEERYFDTAGNPARALGRYHAIRFTEGRRAYLDEAGKAVFLPDLYLHEHAWVVVFSGALLCALALMLPGLLRRVLLGLYVVFMLFMTLMYRENGGPRAEMELFWSYRHFFTSPTLRSSICNNIALFVPFGALLRSLHRKKVWFLAIPLFSVLIELTQYITGLGICEIDDLLSNTLGGLLGFGLVHLVQIVANRKKTDG